MSAHISMEELFARIEAGRDGMIELQKGLTAIPALGPSNQGDGEWAKAQYLKRFLSEHGFDEIEEYNSPDPRVPDGYRPNLVARVRGSAAGRTVWVMSHLDVVPPGDLEPWDSDPYDAGVRDGKIFGRGVLDNQQGIVSSIFAATAFLDLGMRPTNDVALLFIADEETGSKHGIEYVMNQNGVFGKDDFIVVPDAGNNDGTMIEVAEKSIVWFKFTTIGKTAHGSKPEAGINAFKAASHLVTRLERLYEIYPVEDPVFDPPISTFEPTKKDANVGNINTIPGSDVFYMDCRLLPRYSVEALMGTIREISNEVEKACKVTIRIETPELERAAPPTPADAPVVTALKRSIREVYGVEARPMGIGGGTVAGFIRARGYPAVVWARQEEVEHQPNEYCVIDNLVGDTKVLAHLFLTSE